MNTVVVWVLVLVLDGMKAGGPLVIDNISSKQNCEAVASQLVRSIDTTMDGFGSKSIQYSYYGHKCIEVRKVQ